VVAALFPPQALELVVQAAAVMLPGALALTSLVAQTLAAAAVPMVGTSILVPMVVQAW
jgi:hypothetical protein